MNIFKKFGEYPKKEKAKYIISIMGVLVAGGLAVYFLFKATPVKSYEYMATSYFCFFVMLLFGGIPTKSLFEKNE